MAAVQDQGFGAAGETANGRANPVVFFDITLGGRWFLFESFLFDFVSGYYFLGCGCCGLCIVSLRGGFGVCLYCSGFLTFVFGLVAVGMCWVAGCCCRTRLEDVLKVIEVEGC